VTNWRDFLDVKHGAEFSDCRI